MSALNEPTRQAVRLYLYLSSMVGAIKPHGSGPRHKIASGSGSCSGRKNSGLAAIVAGPTLDD